MCVCTHVCVGALIHACMSLMLGNLFDFSLLLFLRQGLSLNLVYAILTRLKLPVSTLPQVLGVIGTCQNAQFLDGCWE